MHGRASSLSFVTYAPSRGRLALRKHRVILDYPSGSLTDSFVLPKVDGEWKIANKAWTCQAKPSRKRLHRALRAANLNTALRVSAREPGTTKISGLIHPSRRQLYATARVVRAS